MKIEVYKVPDTIVIVRDWYTEDELIGIWNELDVICSPYILRSEKDRKFTGAADSKIGHGIFLDVFYETRERRSLSKILDLNYKIYNDKFLKDLSDIDSTFKHYRNGNSDATLVNYYENNNLYGEHEDKCIFTSNIVLWREPKKFDGGKFIIHNNNTFFDFDVETNDMIIFPGYLTHSVTKITMHDDYVPWKSGRYTITNFLNYK